MEKSQTELLRKLFQQKADEAAAQLDLFSPSSGEYGYHYGVKVMAESAMHYLDNPRLIPLMLKDNGEKI